LYVTVVFPFIRNCLFRFVHFFTCNSRRKQESLVGVTIEAIGWINNETEFESQQMRNHEEAFSLPKLPGRLQGPPSLLWNMYGGRFSVDEGAGMWNITQRHL